MKLDIEKIELLKQYIGEATNILISGHISPDGDALGSCIALYEFLREQNKNVSVIVPNRYASTLNCLPSIEAVMVMEEDKPAAVKVMKEADLVFSLDYNTYDRVSAMKPILEQSKARKVLIDHHLYPAPYFDVAFSYPELSSTSQLLYHVLCAMGYKDSVTKKIAECIYLGMMTDTGNFSYNSNSPEIYTVIGELIDAGIDKDMIYNSVFNNSTEDRLRLIGYCLSSMVVLKDKQTAYIILTKEDQERFNFQIGDAEGVVNMPLQISGITRSIMLKEDKDKIKLSFRSQGDIAVNTIAEHFGGGGHKNAAGGESYTTMQKALDKLLSLI